MSKTLATPFFSTGPKDPTAVVDVYKDGGSSVINSYQSPSKLELNLIPSGSKNKTTSQILSAVQRATSTKVSMTPSDLTSRVFGTNTGLTSAFRDLEGAAKARIGAGFTDKGKLNFSMNGLLLTGKSIKTNALMSLGNFTTSYTQKSDMFSTNDKDGAAAVMAGMAREGIRAGIPNMLTAITYGKTDKGTLNRVLQQTLPSVLNGGVRAFKDASTMVNAKLIPNSFPNYSQVLGSSYKLPAVGSKVSLGQEFFSLGGGMDAVEPNWFSKQIGGASVADLSRFSGASPDFQKMTSTGISELTDYDPKKMLGFCGKFDDVDMSSAMSKSFPKTSMLTGSQMKVSQPKGSYDPMVQNSVSYVNRFDYEDPLNAENPDDGS